MLAFAATTLGFLRADSHKLIAKIDQSNQGYQEYIKKG
jgi:hypothetical protein